MNKLLCPICGGTIEWSDDDDYGFLDEGILCLKSRGQCSDCDREYSWEETYKRIGIDNITLINE